MARTLTRLYSGALIGIALLTLAAVGESATLGYTLEIRKLDSAPNFDNPRFRLTNTSDFADITAFTLTLGDTTYNFDAAPGATTTLIEVGTPNGGFTLLDPPDGNGGLRTDQARWSLTGVNAGDAFQFRAELDPDAGDAVVDFRTALAGAVATVTFSDELSSYQLTGTLSDFSGQKTSYVFSQSGPAEAPQELVSSPSALLLLGSGLMGVGIAGWIRRRRS
jgi:hypothetical protein